MSIDRATDAEAVNPEQREIGAALLRLADVEVLASGGASIQVARDARQNIQASRAMVAQVLEDGRTVYGVTTGFGALSDQTISPDDARQLQINLLRSHASGTGKPLSPDVVRVMLALRAHALALGYSGVRFELIDLLVKLFNHDILPVVPEQGSVGASGDLAPLAHLALPLVGEGRVLVAGSVVEAGQALRDAGLTPLQLEPKEALAMINGTQAMTSIASLALIAGRRVFDSAVAAGALAVIALEGRTSSFDERIQNARPHAGQIEVARRLQALLEGWVPSGNRSRPVQDRYSLRAMPQVLGPVLETIDYATRLLEIEINSATDNPLFFPDEDQILNGANFHGHPVALVSDHLKTALASLTTFSERRIASLVDPRASGLPAFLSPDPGLNSGLMISHYVAASLVSENRVLAHPASVDSLSTSADVEDYNSMGTIAARNLSKVVGNLSRVIAIELICAAQAIDLGPAVQGDPPVMQTHRAVRECAPFLQEDQFGVGDWIEGLALAIREGRFSTSIDH